MGMRDDLNAALETVDDVTDLDETPQVVEGVDDDIVAAGEPAVDGADSGESSTDDDKKEGVAEDEQFSSAEAAEAAPSDLSGDTDEKPTDSLKAPIGWSPKEREQWSKVPRELQERINSREREMAENMAGTKEARQAYDQINQVAQSFGPVLAADGFSSPVEAMQAAFGSMSALRMGTAEQKAQEVARIVQQYGIDINALDSALVGNPVAQGADPQQTQIEQMIEQRMAPMNQFMQTVEQLQSQQAQAGQQQAVSAVQEFSQQAEFLGDVREDMADIIDLAAKRGQNLTLQQAYDRACAAHPEISNVLTERKRNEAITGGQQVLASKQNAASSISGRQTGGGGTSTNLSLRQQIASAWDDAGS